MAAASDVHVASLNEKRSMHPFFQISLNKTATPSTPPPTPDSVLVDARDETQPGLKVGMPPTVHNGTDVIDVPRVQDLSYQLLGQEEIESRDVDLNLERRKRRRTSPPVTEPDAVEDGKPLVHTGQSWKSQLEDAARDTEDEVTSDTRNDHTAALASSSRASAWPISMKPLRRSPRKASTGTLQNDKDFDSGQPPVVILKSPDSGKKEQTSNHQRTPKKKILKLNANGRLLSSPPKPNSPNQRLNRRFGLKPSESNGWSSSAPLVLRYGSSSESRKRIGDKINEIAQTSEGAGAQILSKTLKRKPTHPFFLGKVVAVPTISLQESDLSSWGNQSEREESPNPQIKKPAEWKDLVFKSKSLGSSRLVGLLESPWPSLDIHHLRVETSNYVQTYQNLKLFNSNRSGKSKHSTVQICSQEDILWRFASQLADQRRSPQHLSRMTPERLVTTGSEMQRVLDLSLSQPAPNTSSLHPAIERVRSLLPSSMTAIDSGKLDECQAWVSKYAPALACEVLQPRCEVLREWLDRLRVHKVQKRPYMPVNGARVTSNSRKKQRRKKSDDLDDFIVSDDELDPAQSNVKAPVLITGPSGCGKTASVYAVAKELDFEVFEIHPGMRRSAKDILERVGDMAQNHQVQRTIRLDGYSTSGSEISDLPAVDEEIASGKQSTMQAFLRTNKKASKDLLAERQMPTDQAQSSQGTSSKQMQSLILFEEVDILFEEDRGFWGGVLSLIQNSRRPVVLTCNDDSSIPYDDLRLHAKLTYEPPPERLAVDHVLSIAANEGHWLDRSAVTELYRSKRCDLRATISEADFWCQIAVGSQKAGLDWMIKQDFGSNRSNADIEPLRVFSKGTFTRGMDVVPLYDLLFPGGQEELIRYGRDTLQFPVIQWLEHCNLVGVSHQVQGQPQLPQGRLQHLQTLADVTETTSALDLMGEHASPSMVDIISKIISPSKAAFDRENLVKSFVEPVSNAKLSENDILLAFEPIRVEIPQFPPSQGRLAPSLEIPTSALALDIAPYVRFVSSYYQHLEQQRDVLIGGSQGKKTRTTRAARAAMEGGNKAQTRRDRWFPEKTNFAEVMRTGGDWPLYPVENDTASEVKIVHSQPDAS